MTHAINLNYYVVVDLTLNPKIGAFDFDCVNHKITFFPQKINLSI